MKRLGIIVEKYYAVENSKDAIAVSLMNHNEVIHLGDIKNLTDKILKTIRPIDLLVGGPPCQDFSPANNANRKGLCKYHLSIIYKYLVLLVLIVL